MNKRLKRSLLQGKMEFGSSGLVLIVFFGDNPEFLQEPADNGVEFMADFPIDHRIFYEEPEPTVPPPIGTENRETIEIDRVN